MDELHQSLLTLWRLAAQHWRLDDSIAAIAVELGRNLDFQRLLVLEFAPGETGLTSVAHWGLAATGAECSPTVVPGSNLPTLPSVQTRSAASPSPATTAGTVAANYHEGARHTPDNERLSRDFHAKR